MKRCAFLGALIGGYQCWARAGDPLAPSRGASSTCGAARGADGGWHSATYGLLRSGQSLTPLVLNALLDAGSRDTARIGRAIGFIERNVNADGALGLSDDVTADYPCYATALALRAIVRIRGTRHPLAPRMVAWLRGQQMSESNGWRPEHAAFGAWGIGGVRRRPLESGHVDLSMTRHVLEALAEAGVATLDPAMLHARVFVHAAAMRMAASSFPRSRPVRTKRATTAAADSRGMAPRPRTVFSPWWPPAEMRRHRSNGCACTTIRYFRPGSTLTRAGATQKVCAITTWMRRGAPFALPAKLDPCRSPPHFGMHNDAMEAGAIRNRWSRRTIRSSRRRSRFRRSQWPTARRGEDAGLEPGEASLGIFAAEKLWRRCPWNTSSRRRPNAISIARCARERPTNSPKKI